MRKIVTQLVVVAVAAVGLVGAAAAPASAHSYCKKVAALKYHDPPNRGYSCAYQNRRTSASKKERQIRLYKHGVRRATVWVTVWYRWPIGSF